MVQPTCLISHHVDVINLRHSLYLSEHFMLPDVSHLAKMNFDTFDSVKLLIEVMLHFMNGAEPTFTQLFKELKTIGVTIQQELVYWTCDWYIAWYLLQCGQLHYFFFSFLRTIMSHSSSRQ